MITFFSFGNAKWFSPFFPLKFLFSSCILQSGWQDPPWCLRTGKGKLFFAKCYCIFIIIILLYFTFPVQCFCVLARILNTVWIPRFFVRQFVFVLHNLIDILSFLLQNEDRTLWDAVGTYVEMSPYMSANKIKKPILLVHGEEDNNPGTLTMQVGWQLWSYFSIIMLPLVLC